MILLKKSALTFVLLFLLFCSAKAQIQILQKNALEKLKNGTTYILVSDPEDVDLAEYLSVFRHYWKVPKDVQFLSESDVKTKAVPGDSFISLASLVRTSSSGASSVEHFLYLWIPEKSYFRKNRDPKVNDMDGIAKIEV